MWASRFSPPPPDPRPAGAGVNRWPPLATITLSITTMFVVATHYTPAWRPPHSTPAPRAWKITAVAEPPPCARECGAFAGIRPRPPCGRAGGVAIAGAPLGRREGGRGSDNFMTCWLLEVKSNHWQKAGLLNYRKKKYKKVKNHLNIKVCALSCANRKVF